MSPASSPLARNFTAAANDSATYGLFVLVVGTILVPSLCAPTHLDNPDMGSDNPWWYNACSHHTRHNEMPKFKATCVEADVKINKYLRRVVRGQMAFFNKYYKREMDNIKKLYKGVTILPKKNLTSFDWLPQPASITPTTKLEEVLVPLHKDLQMYAVAFHQLRHLELRTDIAFKSKPRTDLLDRIINNLRVLLCEIETAVNLTCQTVPAHVLPTHPDGGNIVKRVDLTGLLIHDWSVLSRLLDFVKGSTKNINVILNKKNERTDDDDDDDDDYSLAANSSGEQ